MTRIGAKPTAETCNKNQHTSCVSTKVISSKEQNQIFPEQISQDSDFEGGIHISQQHVR